MKNSRKITTCAVLLAGGRGTRFWPRSRTRTPKQLLDIVSSKSMLRETADRLAPLFAENRLWVVTNEEQAAGVQRELPHVPRKQILAEPVGRNTAAAIGLAAIHLAQEHGDALMAVLPADHHIADATQYRKVVRAAMKIASSPRKPRGAGNSAIASGNWIRLHRTRRHGNSDTREFPHISSGDSRKNRTRRARKDTWRRGDIFGTRECFSGAFPLFWNACGNICRKRGARLATLQQSIGTPEYARALRRIYPRLENISVDYAIMEPATRSRTAHGKSRKHATERVFVLPAKIGWSDIGSWAAVHELLARKPGAECVAGGFVRARCNGKLSVEPQEIRRGDWRARPSRCGDA